MELVTFSALDARVKGYLWDDYDTLKAHKTRPALVICPGGGYHWRSPREKDAPALEFLSLGFQVFVLDYTCHPKDMSDFRPLRELAETVRQLRERHEGWRIDPDKIAVLGFSAWRPAWGRCGTTPPWPCPPRPGRTPWCCATR